MTITKLSHNPADPRTRVEWTDDAGNDRTLVSRQRPHPDLVEALANLRPVVAEACMLTDGGEPIDPILEHLTVRGLTLRSLEDAEGVTITALREVDWTGSPLVLNTPFASIEMLPSARTERLVEAAVREAALFVEGKRAAGGEVTSPHPSLFDTDDAA